MNGKQRWTPPGWPWELELLALIFVVIAIAIPYYLKAAQPIETEATSLLAQAEVRRQELSTWEDLQGFFWAVIIVGLYLSHLAMGSASIDFMSTPFTHLLAPVVFAGITYFRLLKLDIASGAVWELISWFGGVLVITYMVARMRMARLMLTFRDMEWQVSTPSLFDKTFFELIWQIRPLIYPPRWIRASEEGILLEGWFYAMPISFDVIHAVDAVQGAAFFTRGYCLATSARSVVRIQVADRTEPILISPRDRNVFVRFCQDQLSVRAPPVALRSAETSRGTKSRTSRGTHPGILKSKKTPSGATTHKSRPKIAP